MTTTNRGLLAVLIYEALPTWWAERAARKAQAKANANRCIWERIGYRKPTLDQLCDRFDIDPEQFRTPRYVSTDRYEDLSQALRFMHDQALIDCWTGRGPADWKL